LSGPPHVTAPLDVPLPAERKHDADRQNVQRTCVSWQILETANPFGVQTTGRVTLF
jgi:hypothetical protein